MLPLALFLVRHEVICPIIDPDFKVCRGGHRDVSLATYRHALSSELDGVLAVARDLNEDRYPPEEYVRDTCRLFCS